MMNVPLNQFLSILLSEASHQNAGPCCLPSYHHPTVEQDKELLLLQGEEKEELPSDYDDDEECLEEDDHDRILSEARSVTTIFCRFNALGISQVHMVQDNALSHAPFHDCSSNEAQPNKRGAGRWISQTPAETTSNTVMDSSADATATTPVGSLRQPTRRSSMDYSSSTTITHPVPPRRHSSDQSIEQRSTTPRKPSRRSSIDNTGEEIIVAGDRGRRAASVVLPKCPQRRGSIDTTAADQMIRCPQRRGSMVGDGTDATPCAPPTTTTTTTPTTHQDEAAVVEELHSSLNIEQLSLSSGEEKHHPPTISDLMYSCPNVHEF